MKLLRSFRVRIAAFVVLLSGGMLVATCFVFLDRVERIRQQRIDGAIQSLAFSQLRAFHPKDVWRHVLRSFNHSSVEGEPSDWAIRVLDAEFGTHVYSSENWPEHWSDEQIPALAELPPPRGPDDRRDGPRDRPGDGSRRPGGARDAANDDGLDELIAEFGLGERRRGPMGGRPRMRQHVFTNLAVDEEHGWRIGMFGNQWYTLLVGLDQNAYRSEIDELKRMIGLILPAGLLLVTLGGFWVSHSALRPVRRLTREAEGVTATGLDRRISVGAADREFAQLISVINDMLARLESSFQQATRFSSDAAHELKTPLTILQGEVERLVHDTEAGSDEQLRLMSLQEEVQRISSILRKLLLLSQADGGRLTLSTEQVDLSAWCEELAEDIHAFGPNLRVEMDVQPGVSLFADPDTLRQVLQNLVSNAVKYNAEHGWIQLRLRTEEAQIIFEIENGGPSIPAGQRTKIFDRFYRVDASRSKQVEGTGLGLNLARELARAHRGDLVLLEAGNAFRLTLPENLT